MSDRDDTPKPMTGAEHVQEALRLADLAEQPRIDFDGGNGTYAPTDEQRYRMLMRAHLHANLARTAALVDATHYSDGTQYRDPDTHEAWHKVFAVDR